MNAFSDTFRQHGGLKDIPAWKDEVVLVPWSGIQTLDFGLNLEAVKYRRRFVERTHAETDTAVERILIPLTGDETRDEEMLSQGASGDDEEYSIDPSKAIEPFDGQWLPVPVLRIRREMGPSNEELFDQGPATWARMRVVTLETPDPVSKHTHRIQIAFDTNLASESGETRDLQPSVADAETPRRFRLVSDPDKMAWFLKRDQDPGDGASVDTQAWVSDWLDDLWFAQLRSRRGREPVREDMQRRFEHWARYLTLLGLVTAHVQVPSFRLCDTVSKSNATAPVDVDLVLDLGNSRSCGLMIERFPDETSIDLARSFPLELRDLGRPEFSHAGLFDSALEFGEVSFGDDRFASRSGNRNAFLWPGLVRVGPEARRLMQGDEGTETLAGLSSPKRYLWDNQARQQEWRFHRATGSDALPRSVRSAMLHLNEAGDVIEQVQHDEKRRLRRRGQASTSRAVRPRFSRSACFGLMLAELFSHAFVQVNDPGGRSRRMQSDLPRRLSRIVLTLPTATTAQEQAIIRSRAEGALKLIWSVLGIPEDASSTSRRPQLSVEWDEASCTQVVWLYNETQRNFRGRIGDYFDLMRQPTLSAEAEAENKTLRVASLDIGGGTTDLMITEYRCDDDRVLHPRQIFREGFRLAGDDVVRALIARAIIPALETEITASGGRGVGKELSEMFGSDVGARDQQLNQTRRQLVLRVLVPLAHALLQQAEAAVRPASLTLDVQDALRDDQAGIPPDLASFIEEPMRARGAEWQLANFRAEVPYTLFEQIVREQLTGALSNMTEVIAHVGVDVLLLSGRTSRLAPVVSMISETLVLAPDRIIAMDRYPVDAWYPFRNAVTHCIGDPKSTVAVGAMLITLAERSLPNFRIDPAVYRMRSTARFIGEMERDGQILDDRLIFRSVDLDAHSSDDTAEVTMQAPLHLGFRQFGLERWTATPLYRIDLPMLAQRVLNYRCKSR